MHRRRAVLSAQRTPERGVAIVELTFVSLMLLTIVAATIDYGRGWQSGMAVNEATRTGARVGSGQATSPAADYNALTGVKAALKASNKLADTELVVIFRSDNATGAAPTSCTRPPYSGACHVYTGAQVDALTDTSFFINWPADSTTQPTGSGCPRSGTATYISSWCPNGSTPRVRAQASAEYYGVYIRYRQQNLFPVLGSSRTLARTAVMRLEPPSM